MKVVLITFFSFLTTVSYAEDFKYYLGFEPAEKVAATQLYLTLILEMQIRPATESSDRANPRQFNQGCAVSLTKNDTGLRCRMLYAIEDNPFSQCYPNTEMDASAQTVEALAQSIKIITCEISANLDPSLIQDLYEKLKIEPRVIRIRSPHENESIFTYFKTLEIFSLGKTVTTRGTITRTEYFISPVEKNIAFQF